MQIKRVLELDLSGSKSYKSTCCLCGRYWATLSDAECHVDGLSTQHGARVPLLTLTESSSSAVANKMNPGSMQTPPHPQKRSRYQTLEHRDINVTLCRKRTSADVIVKDLGVGDGPELSGWALYAITYILLRGRQREM